MITRPYVDPKICGNQTKVTRSFQTSSPWVPFAISARQSLPIQVFAQPIDGVAHPFAVVLRLAKTSHRPSGGHAVTINGVQVSIEIPGNGNASASWTLPDGTWAYLRARDLDQGAVVALVSRLAPRSPTDRIPGFDLAPSTAAGHLELVNEHMNSGLAGETTRFQCTRTVGGSIYRVDVETGDPTVVYVALIDRPRPYAVAVNGTGAITIDGPAEAAITPAMVTNADLGTWNAIPTSGP